MRSSCSVPVLNTPLPTKHTSATLCVDVTFGCVCLRVCKYVCARVNVCTRAICASALNTPHSTFTHISTHTLMHIAAEYSV